MNKKKYTNIFKHLYHFLKVAGLGMLRDVIGVISAICFFSFVLFCGYWVLYFIGSMCVEIFAIKAGHEFLYGLFCFCLMMAVSAWMLSAYNRESEKDD